MNSRKLLLISNSTNAGEPFLAYPKSQIASFLGGVKSAVFVPFAAVTFSFDRYEQMVEQALAGLDIEICSVHRAADPVASIEQAEAVIVGGGNTFQLVKLMQQSGIMEAIALRVKSGMPYVGWSAGSNIASPTLSTTNDMPIVEPLSFQTMGLVPFQINPHYLDVAVEGHAGETREQRIEEFIEVNRAVGVVGLREGTMLRIEGGHVELIGERTLRLFRYGHVPQELSSADDLDHLLHL